MKVLLLERHYMLGGFCSTFRRKGFVFDAATHFYPLLGNPVDADRQARQRPGDPNRVGQDGPGRPVPPARPAAVSRCPPSSRLTSQRLKEWFPHEAAEQSTPISRSCGRPTCTACCITSKACPNEQAETPGKVLHGGQARRALRDPRLKIILMADAPHWGSLPDRTSYVFDAMLRLSYFLGNYYPSGSSQKFADDLGRAFTRAGRQDSEVRRSRARSWTEHGKAKGVRIHTVSKRDPEVFEFDAPVVVSNADALHTYRDMLGERALRAVDDRPPAIAQAHLCLLPHAHRAARHGPRKTGRMPKAITGARPMFPTSSVTSSRFSSRRISIPRSRRRAARF